jgi:hypothetical protein
MDARDQLTELKAHESMQELISKIKEVGEIFCDESELFLYPMYAITCKSYTAILHEMGGLMHKETSLNGKITTRLIIRNFKDQINDLEKLLNEHDHPTKSHNEILTEKLLKEAGLQ